MPKSGVIDEILDHVNTSNRHQFGYFSWCSQARIQVSDDVKAPISTTDERRKWWSNDEEIPEKIRTLSWQGWAKKGRERKAVKLWKGKDRKFKPPNCYYYYWRDYFVFCILCFFWSRVINAKYSYQNFVIFLVLGLHFKVLFYSLMLSSFYIPSMFAVFCCAALCEINWWIDYCYYHHHHNYYY